MKKLRVLQQLTEAGVVAVLRADSPEEVAEMARRAIKGGIKAIEITMTVPFALRAIEQLSQEFSSSVSPDARIPPARPQPIRAEWMRQFTALVFQPPLVQCDIADARPPPREPLDDGRHGLSDPAGTLVESRCGGSNARERSRCR